MNKTAKRAEARRRLGALTEARRRNAADELELVAGTAPSLRMIASTLCAISRLPGKGIPCVMIVDSSATTGAPRALAAATSSE